MIITVIITGEQLRRLQEAVLSERNRAREEGGEEDGDPRARHYVIIKEVESEKWKFRGSPPPIPKYNVTLEVLENSAQTNRGKPIKPPIEKLITVLKSLEIFALTTS